MTDAALRADIEGSARHPDQARIMKMIDAYDREFEKWQKRCKSIIKIYTEDRRIESEDSPRRMSLLWSNISTLQPAIYAKTPTPDVSRRFQDADPVARTVSEMMQRCLIYSFDDGDFDSLMRHVRDDFLLTARGTAWVRYEAETAPIEAVPGVADGGMMDAGEPAMPGDAEDDYDGETDELSEPKDAAPPAPEEKIVSEQVCYDYVHWTDFGHNVCRHWKEVTCVWRKVYMDKAAGKKRFGDKFKDVPMDYTIRSDDSDDSRIDTGVQATVYEVWDKSANKVYFLAKDGREPLEAVDPFLTLKGFFPCPKPCYATISTGSLVPKPDYIFYQDQIEEIDELTNRMAGLMDGLKCIGFYPSGSDDVAEAIELAIRKDKDNTLIPIPGWDKFKESGGGKGMIEWWPVEQVVIVLKATFEARKELINDLYQVTGISDIMRGEGDAGETAAAQNIKSQWGSVRIRDRQMALAFFARDCARIGAEIMADKFQPETLMSMSNMQLPNDADLQQQAMEQQIAMMQQQAALKAQMQMAQQNAAMQQQGNAGPLNMGAATPQQQAQQGPPGLMQ